jgi:hypothetical protein
VDPTAFIALLEQCAPGAPVQSLAAIVRHASGFEPLVIATVQGGKPLSVQATSKPEAIALATEMTIAGQRVRIGLAGLDTRDLERLGVSLADAFEPCLHVKAAARLMSEDPRRLKPLAAAARTEARPAALAVGPERAETTPARPKAEQSDAPRPRAWDIYGQSRRSSLLVYGGSD